MHILLFAPKMAPLAHIHIYVDNRVAQGWSNRVSVGIASFVGPILMGLDLAARRQHIHASVGRVPREENKMADSVSRLTHLSDRKFLSHFRSHFLHSKPWHLPPLSSNYKRQLTTMLLNK